MILFFTQYFTALFLFNSFERITRIRHDYELLLLAISTIFIAAAGYLINDYHDVKIDAINRPKEVYIGKIIPRRHILALFLGFNLIALLIGFYLGYKILAVHLFSSVSLWLYSAYLKKRPFTGNFLIALLTALSIFIVAVYYGSNYDKVGMYAALAFFVSLVREIVKDIEDMRGDKIHGARTLPIVLGTRNTKLIIYATSFIFMVSLYFFNVKIDLWSFSIIAEVIIAETLLLIYFIYWADTKDKYHFCSNFCKAILLSGVISMIWAN